MWGPPRPVSDAEGEKLVFPLLEHLISRGLRIPSCYRHQAAYYWLHRAYYLYGPTS